MAIKRSSTKRHKFTTDERPNNLLIILAQEDQAIIRPEAGVCNVAKEQKRNNTQTNTEIRHGK